MGEQQKKQTQKKQRVSVYKAKSIVGAKRHAKAVAHHAAKWKAGNRTLRGTERALRREPLRHGGEMIPPKTIPWSRECELMAARSSASYTPSGRVLTIKRPADFAAKSA